MTINQAIPAIGAVVLKNTKVLLVKRRNPPNQNKWAVPGGKIKLGESMSAAAIREVHEEAGIDVESLYPIHAFDYIEIQENNVRFHYVIVDILCNYKHGKLTPGDDVSEARWIDPNSMGEIDVESETRKLIDRLTKNRLTMLTK